MNKLLKKQRGQSLVEILAVILLIGLVSILILNVLNNSVNQYNEQSSNDKQLNDASYVLKVITKDIRKFPSSKIIPVNNGIKVNGNTYQFDKSDSSIKKNHDIIITNIEAFTVTNSLNNDEWTIYIKNKKNAYSKNSEVKTTIIVRSGD